MDRLESRHQAKGLGPKTVRNIHQIISSTMKLAQEQKLITSNPAEGCALPRLEHQAMKPLSLKAPPNPSCGKAKKGRRIGVPRTSHWTLSVRTAGLQMGMH